MKTSTKIGRFSGGFALFEVLVTVLVVMVGLLGLASLQGKMISINMDAMQRSQALWILDDMVSRIQANPEHAADYVTSGPLGTGTTNSGCATLTGSNLDLCQWDLVLKGSAELQTGGPNLGAMINARGCVYSLGVDPSVLRVVVVWEGPKASSDALATVTTGTACGSGLYGTSDGKRRAVLADVILPKLS